MPSQVEVLWMRERVNPQVSMLAFVDIESRIPLDHPLRTIKYIADEALAELSPACRSTEARLFGFTMRWP